MISVSVSSNVTGAAELSSLAPPGAKDLAARFFARLNEADAGGALALTSSDCSVDIVPASHTGSAADAGRRFFEALVVAFPDLLIQVRSVMGTAELAVVEVKMEGTQATDFLGILNQEKHLDVDQAWMIWARDGMITGIRAYWCQNQLYRRLAVKRLDRISILG
ncbi:MAG TPA: nuclear transport factor 2 family protein [Polyangiaceae bacterium]|nr:nuclear transport factor 2 family protein [Polyangiaceae bacterium]